MEIIYLLRSTVDKKVYKIGKTNQFKKAIGRCKEINKSDSHIYKKYSPFEVVDFYKVKNALFEEKRMFYILMYHLFIFHDFKNPWRPNHSGELYFDYYNKIELIFKNLYNDHLESQMIRNRALHYFSNKNLVIKHAEMLRKSIHNSNFLVIDDVFSLIREDFKYILEIIKSPITAKMEGRKPISPNAKRIADRFILKYKENGIPIYIGEQLYNRTIY